MKNLFVLVLTLCLMILFWACETSDPVSVAKPDIQSEQTELSEFCKPRLGTVTVMTRNVYVGADLDKVIAAESLEELVAYATEAFMMLDYTNFPERAHALANEIRWTRPDVIGMQEIALFRKQIPGDGMLNAEEVLYNYEEILMETLAEYDLPYRVIASVQNFDVEVPFIAGGSEEEGYIYGDVRLTDFDIVLVRDGVTVSNIQTGNYTYSLQVPDFGIDILRGYITFDANVRGQQFRFANTHIEALTGDPDIDWEILLLQQAQVAELLGVIGNPASPVIMLGDFNSPAPEWEIYPMILASGYDDAWENNRLWFNHDGFTFGHEAHLSNPTANFYERIDFVFTKNLTGPAWAIVVGDEQFNRTPSGLWPSDHGGVVAKILFKRQNMKAFK